MKLSIFKQLNLVIISVLLLFGTAFVLDIESVTNGFVVGKYAPHFEGKNLETGEVIHTHSFKGNYLLIDIWSTGCGICVGQRPILEETWNQFQDKNFKIWSIALFDTSEKLQNFRDEHNQMPWQHTVIPEIPDGREFMNELNIRGFPNYVLLSPDGKVLATTENFKNSSIQEVISGFIN